MMLWAISGVGVFEFRWLGWLQPGCSLLPRVPDPAGGSGVNFRAGTGTVNGHHHMGAAVNCSCTWTCPRLKVTISTPKARVKR